MNYWWILYIIDGLAFALVALTTIYFLVFAIASLFSKHTVINKAKHQNRFIVLIPSYKQDNVILQSVNSVLGQTYPQRQFDVVVISDHEKEMTNMRLAQLPITLLTPNFEVSSKVKSLQYAILNLPQFKIYDAVVILNADNVIEPEFLELVNDAYETAGTKAIQTHRLSKNLDSTPARLDSIFEEINNSIFRRGHISVGLSAALNDSGMIFDFEWFKEHVMTVNTSYEDKELEAMLMHEGIFVDYFDNIHVYDEKMHKTSDLNKQRGRWVSNQLHSFLSNARFLPSAVLNRRYDHIDKLLQWLLVPRTIMMGIILLMSVLLPFIYLTLAIKWWIAAALVMFAFALATPDYLVGKHWDKDFLTAPIIMLWSLFNVARAGRTETVERANALKRIIDRLTPWRK